MLADSVPKSLFLGSFQPSVVTKNKDLRSLARFILLLFQQPHEAVPHRGLHQVLAPCAANPHANHAYPGRLRICCPIGR